MAHTIQKPITLHRVEFAWKMELKDLLTCAELQFCANSENKVQVQELDEGYKSHEPSGELQAATTSNPPRLQPALDLPTHDPTQNSSAPPPPEPPSANQPNPHKHFAPSVIDEAVQWRRSDSIPLSTAAETKYCTRVWLEWSTNRA